ncbi:PqqD family protein [Dorea longicatena]|uniref:PqqD family protein n=1 Tax=Dorea longicatena TaxID=88431 RepID=UPI003F88F9EA
MKQYKKPEFHFVRNTGGLSGDEIAKLSDDELTEYLEKDSYSNDKKKYRIKSGFILREIAGEYTIIPVDEESLISNAMMAPNNSAVFLWKAFEQSSTIQDVVVKGTMEYEVSEDTIRKSIEHFVKESLKYQVLEEVE